MRYTVHTEPDDEGASEYKAGGWKGIEDTGSLHDLHERIHLSASELPWKPVCHGC